MREKPLTLSQQLMLARLHSHSRKTPFMPSTAAERSTCEALQRRDLCDSELSLSSLKFAGGRRQMEYKLACFARVAIAKAMGPATGGETEGE